MWGLISVTFALSASLAENLIQAVNIVGSIFYPVMLGLFLVGFFMRWVDGTAVFWGALNGADFGDRSLFFTKYQLPLV